MLTKEYLHEIFTWITPDEGEEPHFVWKVSPDGKLPEGTRVSVNAVSRGKQVNGHIRVRGKLRTVKDIKELYGVPVE